MDRQCILRDKFIIQQLYCIIAETAGRTLNFYKWITTQMAACVVIQSLGQSDPVGSHGPLGFCHIETNAFGPN